MKAVLDASAVLALIYGEPGADVVADAIGTASICAVNVAEVAERLCRNHMEEAVRTSLDLILPATVAVDRDLAITAGLMRPVTEVAGLSLGGRFCLALGRRYGLPVLTADRAWLRIADALGVEVRLIRQ